MAASSILAQQTCCDLRYCCRRHSLVPLLSISRFYRLLSVVTCASLSIISGCKHSVGSSVTQGTEAAVPGWLDLSTKADGKTRSACPSHEKSAKDLEQCAFKAKSTGLVWSARAPRTLNDSARPPAKDVMLGDIKVKSQQLQWGLVAHTELERLEFVPLKPVTSATSSNSTSLATAPAPNNSIKQPDPDSSPISSVLHPNRATTMPTLNNRARQSPLKERKKSIRSGRLPDKFIEALRLTFGKLGYHNAIDNDGRLVLNSDSGVAFASGSTDMRKDSREVAQKLVRLYTETLLIQMPDESQIIHITIRGYTNPRPDSTNASTLNANRRISRKRAVIIRNLIRDDKMWPTTSLSIDGRGEDNSIPRADRQTGPCGIYDCERSRRVELEAIIK